MMAHVKWMMVMVFALICAGCGNGEGDSGHAGHEETEETEEDGEHAGGGEHGEEEGVVHLSESALARSGVRVEPVGLGGVEGGVEVAAEVQLNPDRVAHISPLVEGQLLGVEAVLGDKVLLGQELATLRSVSLGEARAELSRTTALWELARQNLARQERLRVEGITSERSFLEAGQRFEEAKAEREATSSRLRVFGVKGGAGPDMALISPIDGVVIERHATRGENVSPSDTLFVVADPSRVWVIGQVYEQQLAEVVLGMEALLTLNAYPGRVWKGRVDYVGSAVDAATRTLPIRVELDNPEGLLRPGLFGTLRLSRGVGPGSRVVVPAAALQTVDGRSVVFLAGDESGEFVVRAVTPGRTGAGLVEVLAGLASGDSVVVQGAFVLRSELQRGELGEGHAH